MSPKLGNLALELGNLETNTRSSSSWRKTSSTTVVLCQVGPFYNHQKTAFLRAGSAARTRDRNNSTWSQRRRCSRRCCRHRQGQERSPCTRQILWHSPGNMCKTPAHTCVIERRLPRLRLFPPTQRSTGPRRPKTKTKVEAGAGARHRSHRSLQQIVTGRCCREQCPRPSRPPRSHEFMRLIRPPGPCMPSHMTAYVHARTQTPARLQARTSVSMCSQPTHGSAQTAPRARIHTPRPAEAAGNAAAAAAHPPPACGCALHAARPPAARRAPSTQSCMWPRMAAGGMGQASAGHSGGRARRQGTAAEHGGNPRVTGGLTSRAV